MSTKVRASKQINWDADIDLGSIGLKSSKTPSVTSDLVNKGYVDGIIESANAMVFKGNIDCSTNPNYPAAESGHTYRVGVAGKIGGASGKPVSIGNLIMCIVDGTASGDQATVGSKWQITEVANPEAVAPNIAITAGTKTKVTYDEKGLVVGGTDATADDIILDEAITILGVTQGDYDPGEVIPQGTSVKEILKKMLQQRVLATYTQPTLTLAQNLGTTSFELGDNVAPTWTPTWTQNDAGAVSSFRVKKGGSTVYTNGTPNAYAETQFQMANASYVYLCEADYADGVLKNDNFGDASPTGRVLAGTKISSSITLNAYRRCFHEANTTLNTPVTTSAQVRALATNILNPTASTQFTINCASATRITIAYPASIGANIESIWHVEGNGEVKDTFTKTNINVEGANAYTAVSYNIYTLVPGVAFTGTLTVKL